jgi:gluconolactonase
MTQKILVMDSVPEPTIKEFATLPNGYPDGFCFDRSGHLYCAGSLGDVVVVFDPEGKVVDVIEMGQGTEPTNCCLGDGVLYVTLSGPGQLVTLPINSEPMALYPTRR